MTATTHHRNDYADFVRYLSLDGYIYSLNRNAIDAEVIAEMPCDVCGGKQAYEAWRRKEPRGYRALSVCTECGRTEEF